MSDRNKMNDEQFDEFIKNHLDTSFDLEQISVSEELIHRTLEAIKNQPTKTFEKSERDHKFDQSSGKILRYHRYFKGFAGVAAAAFLIFIGYYSLNIMINPSKEDNGTAQNKMMSQDADSASGDAGLSGETSESAAPADQKMADATAPEMAAGDITFGVTADELPAQDNSGGNTEEQSGTAQDNEGQAYTTQAKDPDQTANDSGEISGITPGTDGNKFAISGEKTVLTFRDIIPLSSDQVEIITVTDQSRNTAYPLTDKTDIENFYLTMSNYEYNAGQINAAEYNYTIEIKGINPSSDVYMIWLGDGIKVQGTAKDTVYVSTYNATDAKGLLKEFRDFIKDYK